LRSRGSKNPHVPAFVISAKSSPGQSLTRPRWSLRPKGNAGKLNEADEMELMVSKWWRYGVGSGKRPCLRRGCLSGDPLSNDLYDILIPKYSFLHQHNFPLGSEDPAQSLHILFFPILFTTNTYFLCYQAIFNVEAQDASPERPAMGYVPQFGHGLSELLRHGGTRSGGFIGGISGLRVFICRICPVFMILDKDLGEVPVFFSTKVVTRPTLPSDWGWWLKFARTYGEGDGKVGGRCGCA
jgi:hypothetical protein